MRHILIDFDDALFDDSVNTEEEVVVLSEAEQKRKKHEALLIRLFLDSSPQIGQLQDWH